MRYIQLTILLCSVQWVYAQDTTRLSLLFAGDVMGHDSQIAAAYDPVRKTYNYDSCFSAIRPYVESVDMAIANLEVTLAGPPYKGYPQFSSPDALALSLQRAGFDALVTANNHCVDRGKKGLERTIAILDSFKIPHTGTFRNQEERNANYPLVLHKNGFRIALLNYTYGTNGLPVYAPNIVNIIDTAVMRKDLARTKELSLDVIIVFTHWGAEYQSLPNASQKAITKWCFAQGVHLVIGAHPHVIQPMEFHAAQNQAIVYSLGNFVSGQRKRYTDGGAMAYISFEKIRYAPDSAVTRIDSTGYFLQWVYRTQDASRDYYVLPSAAVENNRVIQQSEALRVPAQLFFSDSRKLMDKYNLGFKEITLPASRVTYKVLLLKTGKGEDPWKILTAQSAYSWGVDVEERGDQYWYSSGRFESRGQANQYLSKIRQIHPEATILEYRNGKLID